MMMGVLPSGAGSKIDHSKQMPKSFPVVAKDVPVKGHRTQNGQQPNPVEQPTAD